MNFKTISVSIATTAALMATAQVQAPQAVMAGKGLAKNPEATAEFQFRLGKNDQGQVRGQLNFTAKVNEGNRVVHVELKDPHGLQVDQNTGIARGEAVLVVRKGDHVDRIPGRIMLKATDVVQPQRDSREAENDLRRPRDKFEINFNANQSDLTYKFEGAVVRGDIKIGGN